MAVTLCESYSGWKILLGEGGDVELGARTSKQISVFALVYLLYIHCYIYLLHNHCYIVDQYSHNKIALRTSNSYLEESRGRSSDPFTGYSSFVSGDRCIITFKFVH